MSSQKLQILLLEDNLTLAEHLNLVVGGWDKCGTVYNCKNVSEGLNRIEISKIDLLIADLHLPDGLGIKVINALRLKQPDAQSIVFSALNDKVLVLEAIRSGASGFLLKDDTAVNILQGCEEILSGGSPMSASIARMVLDSLKPTVLEETVENTDSISTNVKLTTREDEVLNAIAKGFSNREIADLLQTSVQTVPVHIRNIYRKLEVSNRTQAVFEAQRIGLL